jgi:uncharacterized repeat protein (TIGR03847 family)
MFIFDPPDRFVAGTVGAPGRRTFFLQARRNSQVVTVVLEKVQVAVLAERLDQLLDELEEQGVTEAAADPATDTAPLDEPLVEAFRATTLTLGWDADAERVLVEARAEPIEVEIESDEGDEDDPADVADSADEDEATAELDASLAASILAAFEGGEDDDDGPDILRVRLTAAVARSFVERAARVVGNHPADINK